jgi:hypothetical protein
VVSPKEVLVKIIACRIRSSLRKVLEKQTETRGAHEASCHMESVDVVITAVWILARQDPL